MESKKAKVARPVTATPAIVKIEWWNRPITWGIGGLIVLFALVGLLSPDRTPASSQQMMTMPSARVEEAPQRTPLTGMPAAEVHENAGTVNVTEGQAIVDTNNGVVNIGTVNINREPDTASVTRVVEKIVERPVERRVYVESPPVVIHHYVTVPRDTNPRCETLAKEHEARVASWYNNANQ